MSSPFTDRPTGNAALVIRANDHVAGGARPRRASPVASIQTALIEEVMTITQYKARSVSPRRLNAVLISEFEILAVVIAAVGIAGVWRFRWGRGPMRSASG